MSIEVWQSLMVATFFCEISFKKRRKLVCLGNYYYL